MLNAPNLKWHKGSPDVIPMFRVSPDFPIAHEIKEVLHTAVEAEDVYYNTDKAASEVMAEKIRRFNNIPATPDDAMITQGIDLRNCFAVKHSCRPGDEVVLTDPIYARASRAKGVRMRNHKPVFLSRRYSK